MKIRFYGRLADAVGRELDLEGAAPCSIRQLRDRLIADHPGLNETLSNTRVRACVSNVFVDDPYVVGANDCVEFLAPVSGG